MKLLFFPVLFLLIINVSCDKECPVEKNEPNIDIDSVNLGDTITFGIKNNMNVSLFDTLVEGEYKNMMRFDLDIDDDGRNDIRFTSEVWGSPGLGQHPRSTISSIFNDFELYGYFETDTLFLNRIRYVDSSNGIVTIRKVSNETYNRIDENDSILSISKDNFKIHPMKSSDKMSVFGTFKSDTVVLVDDPFYYHSSDENPSADTILYDIYTRYNDSYIFPQDTIYYIGFKSTGWGKEKLGWIKIIIFDQNKILILETAIQE